MSTAKVGSTRDLISQNNVDLVDPTLVELIVCGPLQLFSLFFIMVLNDEISSFVLLLTRLSSVPAACQLKKYL